MKTVAAILLGMLEVARGIAIVAVSLGLFAGAVAGIALTVLGTRAEQASVPKLQGLTEADADDLLVARGLSLEVVGREYHADVKQDGIIRCNPYEGKRVKRGRAVECVLSLGPRTVLVPRLVGLSIASAEARLGKSGLFVDDIRRERSDSPRNQVLRQHPAAGAKVGRSEGVILVASGGSRFGVVEASSGASWVFKRVRLTVPRGAPLQRVRMTLRPSEGEERTAYDRVHRPGDSVRVNIVGRRGWRIQVSVCEKKALEAAL